MAAKLALILAIVGYVACEPYWGGYRNYGYGNGVGRHYGGGYSSVYRSPQGLSGYRYKRDAGK